MNTNMLATAHASFWL